MMIQILLFFFLYFSIRKIIVKILSKKILKKLEINQNFQKRIKN